MNRYDFQQLADVRVRETEALLNVGLWSGAYYLAGYAVKCAIKSCIAKLNREFDFPNKETVLKSYSHDLETLAGVAGILKQLQTEYKSNPVLRSNWLTVILWSEQARYVMMDQLSALSLFAAVTDSPDGVLSWVRARW